ncbi:hypothetical protein ACSBR2_035284 [Camellia fascicularis]
MESTIILLCKYDDETLVINMASNRSLIHLLANICGRWNDLNLNYVCVSHSISGHSCCSLKSDVDVNNMFNFVGTLGLRIVEIVVEVSNSCTRSSVAIVSCQRNEISDEECDVLARYYSHMKNVYLSPGLDDCIKEVGQIFEGGADKFRLELDKYCIELGFDFKYLKYDTERVAVRCKWEEKIGCKWFIHGVKEKANGFFVIKKFMSLYSCGAAYHTSINCRILAYLIARVIANIVRLNPLKRPVEVVRDFRVNYGFSIMYDHA